MERGWGRHGVNMDDLSSLVRASDFKAEVKGRVNPEVGRS